MILFLLIVESDVSCHCLTIGKLVESISLLVINCKLSIFLNKLSISENYLFNHFKRVGTMKIEMLRLSADFPV